MRALLPKILKVEGVMKTPTLGEALLLAAVPMLGVGELSRKRAQERYRANIEKRREVMRVYQRERRKRGVR